MSTQSIIESRRYQMFPTLELEEIKRLRRFGEVRSYGVGEALAKVGEVGHGLTVILAGKVDITQRDESGRREPIRHPRPRLVHGRTGSAGGPSGAGGRLCAGASEGRDHPAGRLRALLIAEAELGERIMRALILRRVGLLEKGDRRPGDRRPRRRTAMCCGSKAFSHRNGHPHQTAEPGDRSGGARRWSSASTSIPVSCRSCCARAASCCAIPARPSSPAASGWWGRSIRIASTTWPSSGPGRRAWPPRSMPRPKGFRCWCSTAAAFGGQAGASARIENYLGFPTGITGMALMARAYNQAQKFGVEMAIPGRGDRACRPGRSATKAASS